MLATELGWTFKDIDDLTMIDVDAVMEHWKEQPPVPMLVRAYLGVGGEKKKPATREGLKELAKMFGG